MNNAPFQSGRTLFPFRCLYNQKGNLLMIYTSIIFAQSSIVLTRGSPCDLFGLASMDEGIPQIHN